MVTFWNMKKIREILRKRHMITTFRAFATSVRALKIDFDKLLNKYNVLNLAWELPKKRPFTNYVKNSLSRRSKNTGTKTEYQFET